VLLLSRFKVCLVIATGCLEKAGEVGRRRGEEDLGVGERGKRVSLV
jgi:hypothetical protein